MPLTAYFSVGYSLLRFFYVVTKTPRIYMYVCVSKKKNNTFLLLEPLPSTILFFEMGGGGNPGWYLHTPLPQNEILCTPLAAAIDVNSLYITWRAESIH